MNGPIIEDQINKENQVLPTKPRLSLPTQRTFGTDLSKTVAPGPNPSSNPQILEYYSEEIFTHLHSTEHLYVAKAGYMSKQTEINEKMRAILIDWLIDVHHRFKLATETLYLTINIIDRYLEVTAITKGRLQLVGVTAMLIASKYEDIFPPEVQDFVNISDKAFAREDVLKMERNILKQLKYAVTVPSAYRFLQRYCKLGNSTEPQMAFAMYFIELSLVDYKMLKFSNSLIAASAVYLMHKFKEIKPEWPQTLIQGSPYKEDDLKICAKELCSLFQQANRSNLQAVKNKFSSSSFYQVAITPYI